jgi:hypothetical protein
MNSAKEPRVFLRAVPVTPAGLLKFSFRLHEKRFQTVRALQKNFHQNSYIQKFYSLYCTFVSRINFNYDT